MNDPKKMTENGIILAEKKRNSLTVVNSLQGKCTGLNKRGGKAVNGIEKSIIDFVMVSQDLVKEIWRMITDNERKYVLNRLTKNNNCTVKTLSNRNFLCEDKTYK